MLGLYLKRYRISKNLTQKQMALKLKTNQAYYSLLENDKKKPGYIMIERIAKLLNISEEFVRGL